MGKYIETVSWSILGVFCVMLIFLAIRELFLWYYKVNVRLQSSERIEAELKKQNIILVDIHKALTSDTSNSNTGAKASGAKKAIE